MAKKDKLTKAEKNEIKSLDKGSKKYVSRFTDYQGTSYGNADFVKGSRRVKRA